ncbi:hypothetical protein [Aquitalea aquatilis]|uniref:hypothetical protein n=1 Tax=Aquitalea aquatilis TaxID=1537400 RepID=UPI0010BD0990|nr:hypothetical protein [Aquitalea aquatilis]
MYKFIRYFQLVLASVFISIYPVYSYATAFPVIQPTIQVKFPTIYPSSSNMPSGGNPGTQGQSAAGAAVGAVGAASVVCFLASPSPCNPSVAVAPSGVVTPPGWVPPSSPTAAPQPPGSVPTQGPVSWQPGGDSANESEACAKVSAFLQAHNAPSSTCTVVGRGVINYSNHDFYLSTYGGDSCPAGYKANSSSSCSYDVSGASGAVQKPAGTPCQVLTDGGSVHWDTANPACADPGAGPFWTDSDGNKESLSNGTFSVVSSDGKNKADIGPVSGNTLPIIQTITAIGADGQTHTFTSSTSVDSTGTVTSQSFTIDGKSVTQDEYNKTVAGNPPSTSMEDSKANTNTGTGSNASGTTSTGGASSITCQQVGTCGVAQESTQTGILATIKSIYDAITGASANTNVDSKPDYNPRDPDVSVFNGLTLPSLNLDWIMHLFPDPVCTDIKLDVPLALDGHTNKMVIPICEQLPWLRTVFGYGWDGMTALTIANMFIRTRADGKVNPS